MKTVIEKHKKAAMHLEEAARFHHEAVRHHEKGNHEKGYHSIGKANDHSTHAAKLEKEIQKHHISALFLFKK